MLRHKTRPLRSGKDKAARWFYFCHGDVIRIAVRTVVRRAGWATLDAVRALALSSVLPDKSWKEKGRKSSQQHEGRCFSASDRIAPHMWAGSR